MGEETPPFGGFMDILSAKTTITIPRGDPNKGSFDVDLSLLIDAEKRKKEVAYVNKETAPELMYSFNEAYCEVNKIIVQLGLEYNYAAEAVEERRAIVLLDIVPEELKKRNLVNPRSPSGSDDMRKAIISLDKELKALNERAETIKAFHQLLRIKSKGLEMAYQAVKKIYDPYRTLNEIAPRLKSGNEDEEEDMWVGKAKFD